VSFSQFGSTVSRSAIPEHFDDSSVVGSRTSRLGAAERVAVARRAYDERRRSALAAHAAPATPAIDARPRATRPRDGAALTACAATPRSSPSLGRGGWRPFPDRTVRVSQIAPFSYLPVPVLWPQALESVRRGNAVGGAVTPPTAFQSVSEKPREPGPNSSTGAVFAAVRTVSCRSA
jgi:hypothetical protein